MEERSLWSGFWSHTGATSIRKAQSVAPEQIRKIAGHAGELPSREGSDATRGARQSKSGAEANSSQLSIAQSTTKTVNSQEGVRRRATAREADRARAEDEPDESDAGKKWILITLPKGKFKTVDHVEVIKAQDDVQLFREIRKRYEIRRPLWLRFLELHDVHKVHLVKVEFFPPSINLIRTEKVSSSTFAKFPRSLGRFLMLRRKPKNLYLRTESLT